MTTRSPALNRLQPGPDLDDLAARLVPGDHPLVALGALAQVLAVDGPDVAAADRRRLHLHQHLAVARLGDRIFLELDGAVAGQDDSRHGRAVDGVLMSWSIRQRSFREG